MLEIEHEFTKLDNFATAIPYSDWNLIIVNLTDDEGSPVPFRKVVIQAEFEEGAETIGVIITNQSMIGVLNYTALQKPGGYLMIATFFGDSYYYSCNNFGVLAITKETCSMDMQEVRIMEDVPIIFNMTIRENDGPPVEGAEIEFYILNTIWENFPPFYFSGNPIGMIYQALYQKYSSIGEIVTIEIYLQPLPLPYPIGYWSGQAYVELWIYTGTNSSSDTGVTTLEWEPTVELEEGTYEIKAVYEGNDYYFACNGTAHLSILPKKIYISTLGYWIDRNYNVEITVLDSEGTPVPNFDLTIFIFNGDTYSFAVTTNENGKVTLNLGELAPGNYTIRFAIVGIEYPTNASLIIYMPEMTDLSLAKEISTWIILSSSIWPEYSITIGILIGIAAGIAGLVGFAAYLEHGNQFTGIPGAIAATIITGFLIGLFFSVYFMDTAYDWVGIEIWAVLLNLYHETGKVIGLSGEFLYPIWLVNLPAFVNIVIYTLLEGLKDAEDYSVGLIVLGPMYREALRTFIALHYDLTKKFRFVYLGYSGSLQDMGWFRKSAVIIGIEPVIPIIHFHTISSFTKNFFTKFFIISPLLDGTIITFAYAIAFILDKTSSDFPCDLFSHYQGIIGSWLEIFAQATLPKTGVVFVSAMEAFFIAEFAISPKYYFAIGLES